MFTSARCRRFGAAPFALLALACSAPSEEIGATLGGTAADGQPETTSSTQADDGGSGTTIDGGSTSTGPSGGGTETEEASSGGEVACFEAWIDPEPIVEADARPPVGIAGMRLSFAYDLGTVTLTEIRGERVVQGSDGPFSVDVNSGSWAELRSAADETIYTRGVFALVPESTETVSPLEPVVTCPEAGALFLDAFPNDPSATHVVFFQESLDGQLGGPTVEFLRFALPR